MPDTPNVNRRSFLTGAAVGGAAATALGAVAIPIAAPASAAAAQATATAAAPAPSGPLGYTTLTPDEAAFVEALVDTMIPADDLSPKGTDIGINIYIDRALSSGWGRGDRLYRQGPWPAGTPNQGYQSALTPAELVRAGIAATGAYCQQKFGRSFDQLDGPAREQVLADLDAHRITFADGPPAALWWGVVYQSVMEGMFADPVHGGNRDKAGWKMIGFPGVIQNNRNNIAAYRNRRYVVDPVSIVDMS